MLRPKPVSRGARLGVFSPSSPFTDERFQAGLARLRSVGYEVVVHPQAHARRGYLAGEDAARVGALHDLLSDPTIDGIIAARGGYGAHRVLEDLDIGRFVASPKALVGFSDVCALHSAVQAGAGLSTIHGPVVTQLGDLPDLDLDGLARVLAGELDDLALTSSRPPMAPGRARGRLVGGCLSVLVPLIGSRHLFIPEGSILLLEDVGEASYRIDRMLTHLHLAGVLARVAGVALGDFTRCDPQRAGDQSIDDVLADRLGALGVPVLGGLPIGHGARNHAVPLGLPVMLDADAGRLTFDAEATA